MSARRNPWGTIFLAAAAGGFAFITWQPWWTAADVRFFRAFFEASLVGALADWFAVTALFRRPLGLPLPHTELLVRRKDQLVEALPRFLEEFLAPARVRPLLEGTDWAGLLVEHLSPADLDAGFHALEETLRTSPSRRAWETKLLDLGAALLHTELSRHRAALVGPLTAVVKRHAGWKGWFVGPDSIEEAVDGFLEELRQVRDRPDHELRRALMEALEAAWPRWARELTPSRWVEGPWHRLEADPAFRQDLNRKIGTAAADLWDRSQASSVLTRGLRELLKATDAHDLARRIEGAVSHDLQYIRVNGAVVGGLAGVALEALRVLGG